MPNKSKWKKAEQPVAVADQDQAPVIPAFAPYSYDSEYVTPYSETLLGKSNELARKIWGSQEGYNAAQSTLHNTKSDNAVKNKEFFPKWVLHKEILRTFSIVNINENDSYHDKKRVGEFVKKLKKLEREYGPDSMFDEEDREQIAQRILMPASQFGIESSNSSLYMNFQYPPRLALVSGIFNAEEFSTLESLVNFIPTMRNLLVNFKPWGGEISEEYLLKPFCDSKGRHNDESGRVFLTRLCSVKAFFNNVFPRQLVQDHIPAARYPMAANQALNTLQSKSAMLRDTASDYIQQRKPLSALLEQIVALSEALAEYFKAVLSELEAYFEYLDRVDMSYETLVKESRERIQEGDVPW